MIAPDQDECLGFKRLGAPQRTSSFERVLPKSGGNMANGGSSKATTVVTIAVAAIAAVTSSISALLAHSVSNKQQSIDQAVKSLEVSAQGRQVEADLSKRREDLLTTQLPRLLSPDSSERSLRLILPGWSIES